MDSSLPDSWCQGRQLYWHPERSHSAETGVYSEGWAHKKSERPERQSSHTGWFLLAAALNGLYDWSNVNGLT
jgi:hypothetical protein